MVNWVCSLLKLIVFGEWAGDEQFDEFDVDDEDRKFKFDVFNGEFCWGCVVDVLKPKLRNIKL